MKEEMPVSHPYQAAMDSAVRYLVTNYNPKGERIGWLMMASILVEAWDLYSIAFVLIFIRDIFHPSPAMLGLAAAGTQGGAIVGALAGGWLADALGRRVVFHSRPWACSSSWRSPKPSCPAWSGWSWSA